MSPVSYEIMRYDSIGQLEGGEYLELHLLSPRLGSRVQAYFNMATTR